MRNFRNFQCLEKIKHEDAYCDELEQLLAESQVTT